MSENVGFGQKKESRMWNGPSTNAKKNEYHPLSFEDHQSEDDYLIFQDMKNENKSNQLNEIKSNYYSIHKMCNSKQNGNYFLLKIIININMELKKCKLDDVIFKKKGLDAKKGHFTSSKRHQSKLLQFLTSNNRFSNLSSWRYPTLRTPTVHIYRWYSYKHIYTVEVLKIVPSTAQLKKPINLPSHLAWQKHFQEKGGLGSNCF